MKYIFVFIVIAFCTCKVNGQDSIHKKLNKKKVHITTGSRNIHITYSGTPLSPTQLNAGSQTLVTNFTPSNAGSYTVKASITDSNYLGEKYRTKFNILKYLPYAAIGLSVLLAIFLFRRKRDETITLPDDEDNFPPLDNAFGINNSIFKL